MRFPFFRNRDSVKNGILISIRRTGDGFHPGLFKIIIEAGLNAQKQFAHNVLRGLTEEETRLCIRVFDKICNNAEEQLKNDKEKES